LTLFHAAKRMATLSINRGALSGSCRITSKPYYKLESISE
jgi:hypothetical protein